MEALYIKGSEDSPEIMMDQQNGTFKIQGNSFPNDPVETFQPVFNWIDKYTKNPNEETIVEFKLDYVNTASAKQITELLKKLENIPNDKKVKVKWFYDSMDEDMEFEGETLKSLIKIDLELVKI